VAVHPGPLRCWSSIPGPGGFIRQFRATFEQELLEIPAGTRDVEGEEPLDTAKRELVEEMGLEASE